MIDKDWFEMKSAKKKEYDKAVWIPLFEVSELQNDGKNGYSGYVSEFFGVGSVLIPNDYFQRVDELKWEDVGISRISKSSITDDGDYRPCDIMDSHELPGIYPVLIQEIANCPHEVWHIHQDIIIALKLMQEGDLWVAPNEDFIEVIKLTKKIDGNPIKMEIRNDFLKDYLCARKMGLYLVTYRDKLAVVEKEPEFGWLDGKLLLKEEQYRWRGLINPINEGGMLYGASTLVIHTERTDIDKDEDVPVLGLPTDENVSMQQKTFKAEGKKLFHVEGELWKNELILPGDTSERIRGDECPNSPFYYTDASGKQECQTTLMDKGCWLWFNPQVINVLLQKRNGKLRWCTKDTGVISCSSDYPIYFGINKSDLITVYAKDIVQLPIWQQIIWAGNNVRPEGKISEEMYCAQIEGCPANTQAPESIIKSGYDDLNRLFNSEFNINLFQEHDDIDLIIQKIQRFRSIDEDGLLSLAKDISRVSIDSINVKELKAQMMNPGMKLGSLKTLQKFLIEKTIMTPEEGYELMTPLFGIYDLRLSDAHLKGSELEEAYQRVGINPKDTIITQGYQLIHSFMVVMYKIIFRIMNYGPVAQKRNKTVCADLE